jgi:Family of unknown function (DUF6719)
VLLAGAIAGVVLWAAQASATTVSKEPPNGQLRYGQRLLVDDGSCPAGQIKELVGGKSTNGVSRLRRCIKR